ncbi:MAG: hypothetical protein AAF420_11645 [Pseudomonadota bacterium]
MHFEIGYAVILFRQRCGKDNIVSKVLETLRSIFYLKIHATRFGDLHPSRPNGTAMDVWQYTLTDITSTKISTMSTDSKEVFKLLDKFLRQNKKLDMRKADFRKKARLKTYNLKGLEDNLAELQKILKAYQRMLRILPQDAENSKKMEKIARNLLKKGIHSATQIANQPRKKFIRENLDAFGGDQEIAEKAYKMSMAVRKRILLEYIRRKQGAEPHVRAVGI